MWLENTGEERSSTEQLQGEKTAKDKALEIIYILEEGQIRDSKENGDSKKNRWEKGVEREMRNHDDSNTSTVWTDRTLL